MRISAVIFLLALTQGAGNLVLAQTAIGTQVPSLSPTPVTPSPLPSSSGQNLTVVAVGEATLEKDKIAILPVYMEGKVSPKETTSAQEFGNLIVNDFAFYRRTFLIPNYQNIGQTLGRPYGPSHSSNWPDFDFWASKMANYLVYLEAFKNNPQDPHLKMKIFAHDIKGRKEIYRKEIVLNPSFLREEGHRVADEIYQLITGKPSIFNSKIVFVCDMGTLSSKDPMKELFVSDFDGHGLKRLTNHRATVISPAISDDKKFIIYSLIGKEKKKRNVDLFLMDLEKRTTIPISTQKGINSGAIFLPDGEHVALTMTTSGNADIYLLSLKTKEVRRLTSHPSDDVDPSFSPDGKTMAFLSGRPGRAMIYTLDTSGVEKNVARISFVGKFNATPRFSPNGQEIVFSSWVDENFDIHRINTQGTELVRLTKDFGTCEDPSYSNDGQFISFSSTRTLSRAQYQKNVYIMDRDGEVLGPITKNLGNCISPRWSK